MVATCFDICSCGSCLAGSVPLLTLFEIYRLFRRWQTRNEPPIAPSRRLSAATEVDGTPRYWADRSA